MGAPVRVVPKAETPLDRMIEAVGIEIEAVKQQSLGAIVLVTDGVRTAQEGAGATYEFTCRTARRPRDDDRVLGDFDGNRVEGCVVSVGKRTIVVALAADLGPRIESGRLMIDRTFLWTSLRDRLQQLRKAPGSLNTHLVAVLTGEAPPLIGEGEPSPFAAVAPALNAEQMLALRRLLGSDVLWGWGPPGTGKTVVCERMIADALYPARMSALLAGPTNRAVDLALGRVLERLARTRHLTAALESRHIVRVGPISDPALQRAHGAAISLDAIVAEKRRNLALERERLTDEEAAAVAELSCLEKSTAADDAGRSTPCEDTASALRETIVALRQQIKQLEHRAKRIRQEVLEGALIVATTVHRAYMPEQVERTFDAVVLDEAGMTNLPAACCAAARARARVAVMGDFRQLGAIVTSQHPDVVAWVQRDAFQAAGIVEALERAGGAPGLVALRVQHRCHGAIAALANAITYHHSPLVTHPSILARPPLPSPWGDAPLLLVDTSPLRPFVAKERGSNSRRNRVHAAIVRWLVEEFHYFGGIPAAVDDPDGLVVLSPFKAQLKLLRRWLPRDVFGRAFELSTVHKFQGGERGSIILDLVDARGLPRLSRFLQATRLSDDGARLLNVAMSRARRRFILVADVRYILRHTPPGIVKQFVSYLSRNAERIELPKEHARDALTFVAKWDAKRWERRPDEFRL